MAAAHVLVPSRLISSWLAAALGLAACAGPGRLADATPDAAAAAPRGYLCYQGSPVVDGRLDDRAWERAAWTEDFVDIQGSPPLPAPRFATRARMLWDQEFLYIGAWMDEPHVWGTLTEHDSVIFHDNDFELFLDPDGDTHQYYEIEINALGTEWDLRLVKPYLDGGPALNEWEIPGLRKAVWVDGSLNDPSDTDRGWSVELAIPWAVLAEFTNRPAPPADGDQWRINFSRVEWRHEVAGGRYRKLPDTPEDNWVWSPQGQINMHLPERWGYLQFSTAPPGTAEFVPDPRRAAREELIRIYQAQRGYHVEHGRWARSLEQLGLRSKAVLTPQPDGWNATIDGVWIRQDRRIWSLIRPSSAISKEPGELTVSRMPFLPSSRAAPAPSDAEILFQRAEAWFAAPEEERPGITFGPRLDQLAGKRGKWARDVIWRAYRKAPIHDRARADFEAGRVRAGGYESPYTLREVGEKPEGGWPLFIAMHGGGGVPKQVNDSQWEFMRTYYRDHPEAGGYLYLALRAPTDEYNGFYTDYVYPLIERLIRQFLLFGEVDPDKVFLMGYSHGGYGAFTIGPKMPDRFAAIHASAASPIEGETTARTLRNTVFSFMVGEKDSAYQRAERCQAFARQIAELQAAHPGAYPVTFEWQPGLGHGRLPDRDKIPSMYPAVRHPVPRDLDWEMTDSVIRDHFWLSVDDPAKGKELRASLHDNVLTVSGKGVEELTVWLDSRLVDMNRTLTIRAGKTESHAKLFPKAATLCESMLRRGDPRFSFPVTLRIELGGE